MPFFIVQNDIARMQTDAVVNAANSHLWLGSGVAGALGEAAGWEQLQEACNAIGFCPEGGAVATPGFALHAKHVIHAVGPVWTGGARGEAELLRRAYQASLELAVELGDESVAFPLLSAGVFGYPRDEALAIATSTIEAFLATHDLSVYLVLWGSRTTNLPQDALRDIARYLDAALEVTACYTEAAAEEPPAPRMAQAAPVPAAPAPSKNGRASLFGRLAGKMAAPAGREAAPSVADASCAAAGDLTSWLAQMDASFSETLLALIDERGLTDAEVYKRANMSRQHFAKIRSNAGYQPTKRTVLALAVALRLSLAQTSDLLARAGFALSHASRFDLIVEYHIRNGIYDVYAINEALFAFDQPLLGQV